MKNIWNDIIKELESAGKFNIERCHPIINYADEKLPKSPFVEKQFKKIIKWMNGLVTADVTIEKVGPKLLQSMLRISSELDEYFEGATSVGAKDISTEDNVETTENSSSEVTEISIDLEGVQLEVESPQEQKELPIEAKTYWVDGVELDEEAYQTALSIGLVSNEDVIASGSNDLKETKLNESDKKEEILNKKSIEFEFEIDKDIDMLGMEEFLINFYTSHSETLEEFENLAIEFESGSEDAYDGIARVLHTLKGDLGVLGLVDFSNVVHKTEEKFLEKSYGTAKLLIFKDYFNQVVKWFKREEVPKVTEDHLACLSLLEKIEEEPVEDVKITETEVIAQNGVMSSDQVNNHGIGPKLDAEGIAKSSNPDDAEFIVDFLAESKEHIESVEELLSSFPSSSDMESVVNSIFRVFHTIKGLALFLGFNGVGNFTHGFENLLSDVRKGNLELTEERFKLIQSAVDALFGLIQKVELSLQGEPLVYPEEVFEVYSQLGIDGKGEEFDTSTVNSPMEEASNPLMLEDQSVVEDAKVDAPEKKAKNKKVEEIIRVSTSKLDDLIDSIGEMVIAQSMIVADPAIEKLEDAAFEKKLAQSNLLLRQIQEVSMVLRMVPVKGVFQKMSRIVRDLSNKLNKPIDFITVGEDTELDRGIVELVSDPLMHMVRNAIDHGIESKEERLASGKPEKAKLTLRSFNRGGAIFIEVQEDGRGLDTAKIREKAENLGLCSPSDDISDTEVNRFIFHPGFSTAAEVTDVSGRGVGMDVVRQNIENLRGSIVIDTEKGRGSTFSIRLPLTLAIIDGMVVRSAQSKYIIPTLSILQSFKVGADNLVSQPDGTVLVKLLGDLIPVVGLKQVLQLESSKVLIEDSIVVVVENMDGKRLGIIVDEVVGQQQIVIKNIGEWLGELSGVTGGAIMNDGTISLILDVLGLMNLYGENTLAGTLVEY